jgi:hypothetical protein
MPLFCDTALAERIERAEAQLMAGCCAAATDGYVRPLAGGVACFAEPGSPFNKVAGVGFAGVPGVTDLDEVEAAFAARGAGVQVELAHLGEPATGVLRTERGFRLESFENVLGLALDGDYERAPPPGIVSDEAAATSSSVGSTSWPTASPTPTPRACQAICAMPPVTRRPAPPPMTPSRSAAWRWTPAAASCRSARR